MKKTLKILLVLLVLSILTLCFFPTAIVFNPKSDEEEIISKVLSSKKISLFSLSLNRTIYNEINGKQIDYKMFCTQFLSAKKLLKDRNTKFYSIALNIKNDTARVGVSYYKSGMLFRFSYVKKDGKWKEIDSSFGTVKFIPSRPYYIQLENMRVTNPTYYRDFNIETIPRDSLK